MKLKNFLIGRRMKDNLARIVSMFFIKNTKNRINAIAANVASQGPNGCIPVRLLINGDNPKPRILPYRATI